MSIVRKPKPELQLPICMFQIPYREAMSHTRYRGVFWRHFILFCAWYTGRSRQTCRHLCWRANRRSCQNTVERFKDNNLIKYLPFLVQVCISLVVDATFVNGGNIISKCQWACKICQTHKTGLIIWHLFDILLVHSSTNMSCYSLRVFIIHVSNRLWQY